MSVTLYVKHTKDGKQKENPDKSLYIHIVIILSILYSPKRKTAYMGKHIYCH